MSIMTCNHCDRNIDTDFHCDDLIGETCTRCVEAMTLEELKDFAKVLDGFDKEYVEGILSEMGAFPDPNPDYTSLRGGKK